MRPLIGTSTKMNLTSRETARYFDALLPLVAGATGCDLFVLPPFTSIWVARDSLAHSRIAWGGHFAEMARSVRAEMASLFHRFWPTSSEAAPVADAGRQLIPLNLTSSPCVSA